MLTDFTMKKLLYLLSLLALLSGCRKEVEGCWDELVLEQELKLAVNRPVQLTGSDAGPENSASLTLTVTAIEDSRCPSDVTCVWYGNATVALRLEGAGVGPAGIALCLGQCDNQSFRETDAAVVDLAGAKYKITLLQVNPYPDTQHVQEQKFATVKVEKVLW